MAEQKSNRIPARMWVFIIILIVSAAGVNLWIQKSIENTEKATSQITLTPPSAKKVSTQETSGLKQNIQSNKMAVSNTNTTQENKPSQADNNAKEVIFEPSLKDMVLPQ